jgi:hypothetical protein
MATKTVTFATTNYGITQDKKHRYLYIVIDTDHAFTVTITTNQSASVVYTVTPNSTGYQLIKLPIQYSQTGIYWTVSISSEYDFVLEKLSVLYNSVRRR